MKNVTLRRWFTIPIYRLDVLLLVAFDAPLALRRYMRTFGINPNDLDVADWRAQCIYGNSYFGLFFHADTLSNNDIAHEIKHLINFIKEHIGDLPCCEKKCDEHDAYLSGYITERVYGLLKRHNVTIYNN